MNFVQEMMNKVKKVFLVDFTIKKLPIPKNEQSFYRRIREVLARGIYASL